MSTAFGYRPQMSKGPPPPSIVPRERVYGRPTLPPAPALTLEYRQALAEREAFKAGFKAAEEKFAVQEERRRPMREICEEVAEKHGVTFDDLRGERRQHNLVVARWEAAWRCFSETQNSYPAIGRMLHKDHTTIMNAVKRYQERMAQFGDEAE